MDATEVQTKREMFAAMVETAIGHYFRYEHLRSGEPLRAETRQAITDEHREKWLRKYDAAPDGEG